MLGGTIKERYPLLRIIYRTTTWDYSGEKITNGAIRFYESHLMEGYLLLYRYLFTGTTDDSSSSLAWQGSPRRMQQWSTTEDTNHGSFIHPEAREGDGEEGLTNSKHGQRIKTLPPVYLTYKTTIFAKGSGDFPIRGMGASRKEMPPDYSLWHPPLSPYNYRHVCFSHTPLLQLWTSFESISLKQHPFCQKNRQRTRTSLASLAKVGIKYHSTMITLGITILSRPVTCTSWDKQ